MAHQSATLCLFNGVEHHKQVQVGVRTVLAASNGPEQSHFHRVACGDNLVHDERQRLKQRKTVITALAIDGVHHGHIDSLETAGDSPYTSVISPREITASLLPTIPVWAPASGHPPHGR